MGKVVERKKRKKKGRPSLLDLQKRSIQEENQHQQNYPQQKRNPNPNFKTSPITPTPIRRSTRRNSNTDEISQAEENADTAGEDDDDELSGKRREKKLKFVLKLPSQRSSLNSTSPNSGSYNSDSNAEDDAVAKNHKKGRINAIGDGSGHDDTEKAGKHDLASKTTNALQGTQLDMGTKTPVPDKKLLLFVLERLQKKDTYGVFSEPVDPNELPDYHEVIEHPMDFGTVRKNLASGAYADLEGFEKDVFLICSNAMQYNAPDTIYFRQARSIQELAKKNFEDLRHDSDENEPERKIVKRGRPPTKNLNKQMVRPSLDRSGLEFSSDATLATAAENTTWSNYLRRGPVLEKSGLAEFSGRSLLGSRYGETYSGLLPEHKLERNDELPGSMSKGSWKQGKKLVLNENRRNTYKQSHLLTGGQEPSVLSTFDGERKQLMPVGIQKYGYARSLARFAANLGPVTWKVASKRIEKSLPPGVNFGPGWVGENEAVLQKSPLLSSPPVHLSPSNSFSPPGNSSETVTPSTVEMKAEKSSNDPERDSLLEKHVPSSTVSAVNTIPSQSLLPSPAATSSPIVANGSPEPIAGSAEPVRGFNSHSGFDRQSSNLGVSRPGPSQIHPKPVFQSGMNGFKGAYPFHLPAHMGRMMGSVKPTAINHQSPYVESTMDANFAHPVTTNSLNSEDSKFLENTNSINTGTSLPNSGHHPQGSWREVPLQRKSDSVPPDLNVRFQSPGSPSSSRVDPVQPDLALQL
ncbi:uncharacterized protein LOC132300885 [Cornus florida]|uniref:uncharacterized protein LOC132300885 n=1 Tax=Cornus florida TaxID=4283 RepID=UPI0028966A8A|nr:uncharacterized protein LOC132300885 [Cornus florida]